jgi:uncharacterized protein (TIGR02594 family)
MQWLMYLLRAFFGGAVEAPKVPTPPEEPVKGDPAWLKLARAELGVKEIVGPQHNPTVIGYFRDAGFPEIDTDETAWCAGFANAMLERSGAPGSKSLAARSFLTWGKPITKPYPGCIAIFSRGDPRSWEGHVGFFVSEDGDKINVLGGNQSNQVSIAAQARGRLLGFREPVTAGNSRTLRASAAGVAGDAVTIAAISGKGIVEALPDALALSDGIKSLAAYWPWFAVIGITISILARAVVVWARVSDLTLKGR